MADKKLDEYITKTDLDNLETDGLGVQTKKVSLYALDINTLEKKRITGKQIESDFAINVADRASEETLQSIAGLNIPKHDTRELEYTDGNLTAVIYKLGGAIVATKTLTYTDGNLSSVVVS